MLIIDVQIVAVDNGFVVSVDSDAHCEKAAVQEAHVASDPTTAAVIAKSAIDRLFGLWREEAYAERGGEQNGR